jgi:hypothetical protein
MNDFAAKVRQATADVEDVVRGNGKGELASLDFIDPTIPTLADILVTVCDHVARYIVLPSEDACRTIALWIAHTHVFDQFDLSPYLNVFSPEKRSGKTRLAEVLEQLVPHPWLVVTPSEAVVYRKIDAEKPTLLLDEVDAVFGAKASNSYEGLRALFNAGNRKSTKVSRCLAEGKNFRLVDFEVFCPKAFFGIGDALPATVADRAIPIRLQRRRRDEPVERFRVRKVAVIAASLHACLQAWAESADFDGADPELPAELGDREQDCWEPLLAIADMAGGAWPEWGRQAAVDLAAGNVEQAGSTGTLLLAAIRRAFAEDGADRLLSEELAARLNAMEEWPWDDLTKNRLASQLKPYRISSTTLRTPGARAKGYYRDRFTDAFARYLPAETDEPCAEQEAF